MAISLQEHIDRIRALSNELQQIDRPVFLASNSALAEFSKRVFQEGKSTSGAKFQYNSTNPLYVNPSKTFGNTASLKPPRGKSGKTQFKDGKNHKTTYVNSYRELRQLVGRESDFVNWVANGDLKSDIENNSTLTTRKVQEGEYKISSEFPENQGKLKGFFVKYPNVFKLSESEKKTYYKVLEEEVLQLINQRLGNA